jgi:probable F420-dependent oxidoreductase
LPTRTKQWRLYSAFPVAANQKGRPFRFGVQLSGADSADAWIDKAKRAESLGYSVVTIIDHMGDQLAPIPALTALAMSTTSIRVGTMVLANDWRNPLLVAREAATLDWLSNGRLELGIGAGWLMTDYEQLGVPYDRPGVRVERMAEALRLIRDLLSGERITHSGPHYRLSNASCFPRPVQKPHPPLVVGGGSRRLLTLAGQLADVVNVHTNLGAEHVVGDQSKADLSTEAARLRFEWVREGAASRLQEIELGLRIFAASVTDRPESAAAELGRRWQLGAAALLESPYALVGSLDHITEGLMKRRQEFGATYFTWNEPEMEMMAPIVRRLAA